MASIAVVDELEAGFEWAEHFDCNLGIVAESDIHSRPEHYIEAVVASVVDSYFVADILVGDFVADILAGGFIVVVAEPSTRLISVLQLRPLRRSSCEVLLVY